MEKPTCKLPTPDSVSFLIGDTVKTLRNAGMQKEMRNFINQIRRKDIDLDYYSVFDIAKDYVTFY